ncbi:hypothetical protein STCU_10179 [Strigomonas culicis]|uniref:Uncharacterized protein n=1 Tax=Strigomonas culicis TaxID=28005 RepID=S9TP07_9TRYP|nr:hypothetical protein STCU_10179 [Strigomonas culicis]|eukprot:EPY18113.1 hypothetical protein STCU_10179 [Strigomonas culicis]
MSVSEAAGLDVSGTSQQEAAAEAKHDPVASSVPRGRTTIHLNRCPSPEPHLQPPPLVPPQQQQHQQQQAHWPPASYPSMAPSAQRFLPGAVPGQVSYGVAQAPYAPVPMQLAPLHTMAAALDIPPAMTLRLPSPLLVHRLIPPVGGGSVSMSTQTVMRRCPFLAQPP